MTEDEARTFLREGRAARSDVATHGWQIAHEVAGELEWFSVTEADAALLSRLSKDPDRPAITIPEMDQALCRRHLLELVPEHHPSGVQWQSRWATLAIELSRACIADERIMRRAGWNPETGALAQVDTMTVLLAEASPLCCFLSASVLDFVKAAVAVNIEIMKKARRDGM